MPRTLAGLLITFLRGVLALGVVLACALIARRLLGFTQRNQGRR